LRRLTQDHDDDIALRCHAATRRRARLGHRQDGSRIKGTLVSPGIRQVVAIEPMRRGVVLPA
jgi:hypothetical protein